MLTICNDPARVTGIQRHQLDHSLTLQENIERHIQGGTDYSLYLNGQYIEYPAKCDDLDRLATFADSVCLVNRPGAVNVVVAVVVAIVSAVVAYAMMPSVSTQQPRTPNDTGSVKNSPNNQLTGQTNIARAYQANPDIYGTIVSYPDLIQQSVQEYVNNIKHITEIMCIGLGKYTVSKVKYAETLLDDIAGVSYEIFSPTYTTYPEDGITTIAGVYEPFRSPEVNGQELIPIGNGDIYALQTTLEFTPGGASTIFRIQTPEGPGGTVGQQFESCQAFAFSADVYYGDECFIGDVEYPEKSLRLTETMTVISRSWSGNTISIVANISTPWPAANPCYSNSPIVAALPVASVQPINSLEPWIGPFVIPSERNTDFWFNIEFLKGLKGIVTIGYEWWRVDDLGNEVSGTKRTGTDSFSGDTYDQKFYTVKKQIESGLGKYKFRIKRTNASNGDGSFDVAKITDLFGITYYAQKTFPGVTLIKVTTPATEQATSIKERRFNCQVQRHCLKLADNSFGPTDMFYDAIYHMFAVIAKRDVAQIDREALFDSSWNASGHFARDRFCFSFDDKDVSLGSRMQIAANCCRVQVFRDGRQWTFARDRIREPNRVGIQLDYRNLAGSAESTRVFSGTLPSSKDGVKVEYTSPETNKRTSYQLRISSNGSITVGTPDKPMVIQLAGCRDHDQAQNRAHYEARRIIYQRETVSDTALSDASIVGIGDLVRWIDPQDWYADGGLWAGEVLAFQTDPPGYPGYRLVTTSEPVRITGASQCTITSLEGVPSSVAVAHPRTDGKNGFYLAGSSDAANNLFSADGLIQCGARYAVAMGSGVTPSESYGKALYVLQSKKPDDSGKVAIELVNYDARIYEMDGETP